MQKLEHTHMNSTHVSFIHYILKELQTAALKIIEQEFIARVTFVFRSPPFWTMQSCWMRHDGGIVFRHEKDQNLSIIVVIFIERAVRHSVRRIRLVVAVPSIKHLAVSTKYY
jgi:hypothetical protein